MLLSRVLLVVVLILSITCAFVAGAYAATNQIRRAKRPLRGLQFFGFLWMALVFIEGLLNYAEVGGIMPRIGMIFLLFTFLAEYYLDWRRK